MCKNVGREGTANLVVIPALVQKISKKTRGGLEIAPPPPVGRGLNNIVKSEVYVHKKWVVPLLFTI